LAAPENQGFRKLRKLPREGKKLGKYIVLNSIPLAFMNTID
jgi:hypothetical protein